MIKKYKQFIKENLSNPNENSEDKLFTLSDVMDAYDKGANDGIESSDDLDEFEKLREKYKKFLTKKITPIKKITIPRLNGLKTEYIEIPLTKDNKPNLRFLNKEERQIVNNILKEKEKNKEN